MNKQSLLLVLACLASAANAAGVSDILWLSDVAPKRARPVTDADHSSHGKPGKQQDNMDAVIGGDEGDNLHSGSKRLWLRQGDDPANAGYVNAAGLSSDINLINAQGKRSQVAQTPVNGLAHAKCDFTELGFYNAHVARESVQDGVLRRQLAKAELLKGSCCMKPADVDPAQTKAISDPTLPLEIVRQHKPDELLFTRIVSGDKISFTIIGLGKPLPGVPVTMLTQQGWQKKAVSDENGRVEFTMIRDYFPAWNDFKRRTKESFVILAETEATASGKYLGQPYVKVAYQATLSGKYAPSPYDYKSYAWGLGIAFFVLTFSGLGVYLYRRRRLKPFQEIRFNESA
ncbi:hypothetical protein [Propionivibrio sp.]|uniref:hypothetical protein n=1 Tax=Propionivibrio sp. TaxID=2212460 RepID=UPI003BF1B139